MTNQQVGFLLINISRQISRLESYQRKRFGPIAKDDLSMIGVLYIFSVLCCATPLQSFLLLFCSPNNLLSIIYTNISKCNYPCYFSCRPDPCIFVDFGSWYFFLDPDPGIFLDPDRGIFCWIRIKIRQNIEP